MTENQKKKNNRHILFLGGILFGKYFEQSARSEYGILPGSRR